LANTGYNAYLIAFFTKRLLYKGDLTYKFVKDNINGKYSWYQKHVKNWNENHRNQEGVLYQQLEKRLTLDEICECFFAYSLKDKNFFISNILQDDMATRDDHREIMRNLKKAVSTDWRKIASQGKNKKSYVKVEVGIPPIVTQTRVELLAAYDRIFDIFGRYGQAENAIATHPLEKGILKAAEEDVRALQRIYPGQYDINAWRKYARDILLSKNFK
jgi:hypothetical protein